MTDAVISGKRCNDMIRMDISVTIIVLVRFSDHTLCALKW